MDAEIIYDEVTQKGFPLINGAKVDPLYFFAPQEITFNFGPFNNSKAYFNQQDGAFIPIVSGNSGNACTFSEDGEECVSSQYFDKTNTQLSNQYNNSFLGTITPSNAETHAMVIGGKVTNINTTSNLEIQTGFIKLHPNPTNGIFIITGDFTNYSIQIIDVNGNVHQDLSNLTSPIEIDISNLPNGIYIVKVLNNNNNSLHLEQIIKGL